MRLCLESTRRTSVPTRSSLVDAFNLYTGVKRRCNSCSSLMTKGPQHGRPQKAQRTSGQAFSPLFFRSQAFLLKSNKSLWIGFESLSHHRLLALLADDRCPACESWSYSSRGGTRNGCGRIRSRLETSADGYWIGFFLEEGIKIRICFTE